MLAQYSLSEYMVSLDLLQGLGLGKKAIDAAADLLDFLGILKGGKEGSHAENGTGISNDEDAKVLQRFTPEEWMEKVKPVVAPLYVNAELLPGSIR